MAAGSLVGCQNPIAEFSFAHGRPRCQGRRGEPFIGAQRNPLQRKLFASEEQLSFVKFFCRLFCE
jgi:hypothetical protein